MPQRNDTDIPARRNVRRQQRNTQPPPTPPRPVFPPRPGAPRTDAADFSAVSPLRELEQALGHTPRRPISTYSFWPWACGFCALLVVGTALSGGRTTKPEAPATRAQAQAVANPQRNPPPRETAIAPPTPKPASLVALSPPPPTVDMKAANPPMEIHGKSESRAPVEYFAQRASHGQITPPSPGRTPPKSPGTPGARQTPPKTHIQAVSPSTGLRRTPARTNQPAPTHPPITRAHPDLPLALPPRDWR